MLGVLKTANLGAPGVLLIFQDRPASPAAQFAATKTSRATSTDSFRLLVSSTVGFCPVALSAVSSSRPRTWPSTTQKKNHGWLCTNTNAIFLKTPYCYIAALCLSGPSSPTPTPFLTNTTLSSFVRSAGVGSSSRCFPSQAQAHANCPSCP